MPTYLKIHPPIQSLMEVHLRRLKRAGHKPGDYEVKSTQQRKELRSCRTRAKRAGSHGQYHLRSQAVRLRSWEGIVLCRRWGWGTGKTTGNKPELCLNYNISGFIVDSRRQTKGQERRLLPRWLGRAWY